MTVTFVLAARQHREGPGRASARVLGSRGGFHAWLVVSLPYPEALAEMCGVVECVDHIFAGAALFHGLAALNTYAMLAWLPTIFARCKPSCVTACVARSKRSWRRSFRRRWAPATIHGAVVSDRVRR